MSTISDQNLPISERQLDLWIKQNFTEKNKHADPRVNGIKALFGRLFGTVHGIRVLGENNLTKIIYLDRKAMQQWKSQRQDKETSSIQYLPTNKKTGDQANRSSLTKEIVAQVFHDSIAESSLTQQEAQALKTFFTSKKISINDSPLSHDDREKLQSFLNSEPKSNNNKSPSTEKDKYQQLLDGSVLLQALDLSRANTNDLVVQGLTTAKKNLNNDMPK